MSVDQSELKAPPFFLRAGAAATDSAILFVLFYAAAEVCLALAGGRDAIDSDPALMRTFLRTAGLVVTAISAGYFTIMTGSDGQTFGKKLAVIKVVSTDGRRLGFGKAFARWVGYQLCAGTLGLGFAMAAFTQYQRGLHDALAGTRVVICGGITRWRKAALSVFGIIALGALCMAGVAMLAEIVRSFIS